jgi:PAS domain S-box-containing protein
MEFVAEKDTGLIPYILTQIMDSCVNGITLADPDQPDDPIVYANEVFCRITGYSREEILGRNCRFLHGDDREQPGLARIREALRAHQPVDTVLRNYRKDGTLFYNRLHIRPLFDRDGRVIYYLGVQHDVTEQIRAQEALDRLSHTESYPPTA